MGTINIRFNTEREKISKDCPAWRVIYDNEERLAEEVLIKTSSRTTEDILPDGRTKWHISCEGQVVWDSEFKKCTIISDEAAT